MNKAFTLVEMLIAVLIITILSGMAVPNYMRSVEKARSTEAMQLIKSINDAAYGYAAEHNACPPKFSRLMVDIPKSTSVSDTSFQSNGFTYYLNGATNSPIPGTPGCGGLLAVRDKRGYKLWNPYRVINENTKARTIACTGTTNEAIKICQGLGVYVNSSPN